jgi:hypothetical protein
MISKQAQDRYAARPAPLTLPLQYHSLELVVHDQDLNKKRVQSAQRVHHH